ncbi:subtilisin-like protein [Trichodelitschia bisporula]|uniref:tripeptidyl-peptidase II n=1 Tax=Trichodelitschia bisporula TaxID=703511 RepID=A0A6G1IAU5_9PEZI|nr:subtilisin-like protein [Trichodelitschia bisporula]
MYLRWALLLFVTGLWAQSLERFESLAAAPPGWNLTAWPHRDTRLNFRIALKSPNQAFFEQTLYDMSTPNHPTYGRHLKRDELNDLLQPSPGAVGDVLSWLVRYGVNQDSIVTNVNWITFTATVTQAEAMMDTEFGIYTQPSRPDVTTIRTLHYSIPQDLFRYVDMVQPTTRFSQLTSQRNHIRERVRLGKPDAESDTTSTDPTFCNRTMTPSCLKALYCIDDYLPRTNDTGFVGVAGFLDESAQYEDFISFTSQFAPWANGTNFTWSSVNGGQLGQGFAYPSYEANLDMQYAAALGFPVRAHFYSTAGQGPRVPDLSNPPESMNTNEPYLEFFTYLLNQADGTLPHTLTISYGEAEQTVPANYSRVVCNMIGQLGARGVTVIFSSGDDGVGSNCQTNDGRNATRFQATFPATCPFVTSVGSTQNINPERAALFSSGGFSERWPRPWYQETAVENYLAQLGSQWAGLFNPYGRAIPDISAQGKQFRVVDSLAVTSISGTSASAPTVAGLVGLINAARIEAGQAPLGMMNPWLYLEGFRALTDIVHGGSTGCLGTVDGLSENISASFVPFASWNATKGWDPVTGLGTPRFHDLVRVALQPGTKVANSR